MNAMPATLRTRAGSTRAPGFLPASAECTDAGLEVQQRALAVEAAAEARERAVGADHAVARDDHRDRVAAVGEADGADGPGVAEAAGERAVGGRLAGRDLAQHRPHALLELSPVGRELQGEVGALAGE